MYNKSVVKQLAATLLVLTAAQGSAWARPSSEPVLAQNPAPDKTLTGMVTDSKCKGHIDRKAVTLSSCARQCTHFESADYVSS